LNEFLCSRFDWINIQIKADRVAAENAAAADDDEDDEEDDEHDEL
jgi:hypothetical protein